MRDGQARSRPRDTWAGGDAYEMYVGRWSRLVAREFLSWLTESPGGSWLDVGCGTGALTQTILETAHPSHVKGIDRSNGFVDMARRTILDRLADFAVGDAQALAIKNGAYDAVVSSLVLNFIPEPERAVSEMARTTRPGGSVAVYVWDYAGKMQFMRHFWDAATALDPTAYDLDEGRRFPLCQPDPLKRLFQLAGLGDVQVRPIDISTDFADFSDYWSPFLGGQGPAPSYAMSLDDESRAALRERIRASLPYAADGSIPLVARAWAVRGVR